jgi:hypothetical protein
VTPTRLGRVNGGARLEKLTTPGSLVCSPLARARRDRVPAIGYDEQYTYASRIDSGRASTEAQQHPEDYGTAAGSLSKMR